MTVLEKLMLEEDIMISICLGICSFLGIPVFIFLLFLLSKPTEIKLSFLLRKENIF